jgi:hypothetical protein
MDVTGLLLELYGRLPPLAHAAVEGCEPAALTTAPSPGANTIAWLVWHAARVEDDHVGEVMGVEQLWAGGGWAARFGLPADTANTGYGHGPADVAAVVPREGADLLDYFDAVHARSETWLPTLSGEDLDRIVDRRWDPPVTLGVRLVSVADDALQHLGQAAYLRGLATP